MEAYPDECCGFFYGAENEQRIIEKAVRVTNSQIGDKRRKFQISPLDYMKAERYALENATTLLGIYHSHPDHPAAPSAHDLKFAMPFFSYIIISVMQRNIANMTSWRLNETGNFEEESILKHVLRTNQTLKP